MHRILPFVLLMGLLLLVEITLSAYLRSTITTIERRFQLSSTQASLITSGFQIGNLTVLILVSYIGQRYHRPRVIGLGGLLLFVGFFIISLPQFLGGRYEPTNIGKNIAVENDTNKEHMCDGLNTDSSTNAHCESNKGGESSSLYYMIIVGLMICGIGGAPIASLGYAYVDDYTEKHESAFYIGILQTIGLVGPALGYILGSVALNIWVDVFFVDTSTIDISTRDPRWVGAWWLGVFIGSFALLLVSIPFFFFPKTMKIPKTRQADFDKEQEEMQKRKEAYGDEFSLTRELGMFFGAIKRLWTNVPYVMLISIWTIDAFNLSGSVTFSAKYLETAFGQSAASANMLIGALNLPFLIVGTAFGSYMVKKWKFGKLGAVKAILFASVSGLILFVPGIFLGCDTIETVGINRPYPGRDLNQLQDICNAGCGCPDNIYEPVCGPDDLTYVSPCHAGCSEISEGDSTSYNYTQCACVDSIEMTVTPGRCKNSNCGNMAYAIVAMNALSTLIAGLGIPCSYILLLSALKPSDKSLGIGMSYFTFRLLAWIPGPLIFGKIIDQTCMLWTTRKCTTSSYCSVFDSTAFRYSLYGMVGAIKIVSTSVQVMLLKHIKKSEKKERAIMNEEKGTLMGNGNGYHATKELKGTDI